MLNKGFIFILISLVVTGTISAPAKAQENLEIKVKNCPILLRKKFTRSWATHSDGLEKGTPIRSLGQSTLGNKAALIFDVVGQRGYKNLEFKAPQSCFGEAVSETPIAADTPRPEKPSPSSQKATWFRTQALYIQEVLSFVDAVSSNSDRVVSTNYGLGIGFGIEKSKRRHLYGINFSALATRASGTAPSPVFNTFNASAYSFGALAEPYYFYRASRKFSLGIGFTLIEHYTLWSEASTGHIFKKLTFYPSAQIKTNFYYGKKSEVGLDGGLGITDKTIYIGLHYGFQI